ncbi:glycine dehydrogenase subunit 2 [Dethiosulfatibacter aminovorans DSM 17477]|uniref:glycine dehydrogenase (aminomethyl-transferring) n=1 Tax=Dethiosulfatibacter aminovorans DSM 17477 TaxID=1121476 RepID=A0A1M6ML78_9FIRM|nr:aminomethyl-transferring glycine dehydrogenase subunit GcvPB [Dethiosulfatibacter aminovorans]SHJ84228.1 glycine dehydrogenase subunit 2 [Dethiosulfatibacter aminovorans DSM 17477]
MTAKTRSFHEAKWDEPIIFELSEKGQRGILLPEIEKELIEEFGEMENLIPEGMARGKKPELPEISQPQVLRHYLRLSQETLGQELNIDIGLGTCTMKYSPKIHEQFVRNSKLSELHPLQNVDTAQGILEIMYEFEQIMKEISGMDAFSFQPGGGGQAIYSNASIMKSYHADNGEGEQRTEIITTLLSHPLNAAAPHTKGFKVINLIPNETGYPSIEDLKAVVSEKTAGIFITNPEDTGIYNPIVKEFVDIVHEAGGLCVYDMADYNGLFGIARAKEAGLDMCHFNLHKAFSSPHGSMGPCCGAQGVSEKLAKYLPVPRVGFDGGKYFLDYDQPHSIGKIRKFYGVAAVVLRAYSWVITLGADGLRKVAETSVINNNYLIKKMLENVRGISAPWGEKDSFRTEQVRFSWEQLTKDTGVTTDDIDRRGTDYGLQCYFQSHHPMIIPEPFTPEPNETYSKQELDEYIAIFKRISEEAYENPELVKNAPHNAPISKISTPIITDPNDLIVTWRAYKSKKELPLNV